LSSPAGEAGADLAAFHCTKEVDRAMRIRTQLFLGTATLVLALLGLGWWLQTSQLEALQRELTEVAAAVSAEALGAPNQAGFHWKMQSSLGQAAPNAPAKGPVLETHSVFVMSGDTAAQPPSEVQVHVESVEEGGQRFLLVRGMPGWEKRVAIPPIHSERVVAETIRRGLGATALLLAAGLAAAALFAHRFTGPLRRLAAGADALARGGLGTQVVSSGGGEVGELEHAFNRMSARLAELEGERQAWLAREHLAELGDVARGLAHTLRNPLHTLGLVVEELASSESGGNELVGTARAQIRRIDGWLRSFLSLGAGGAAQPGSLDLADLARDVALEAAQCGGAVRVATPEIAVRAWAVGPSLRAAVANLVANGLEASPPGAEVTIEVAAEAGAAVLRVLDRGRGVPDEVRARLFAPHVTTKADGSGMGLFLARQLVVSGLGGALSLAPRPGGGTIAELRLPASGLAP
jgi:signal transduction histidine kinase